MALSHRMAAPVLVFLLLLVATGTVPGDSTSIGLPSVLPCWFIPSTLVNQSINLSLFLCCCRDGAGDGGGGEALPVAEPPLQGPVREQQQLRQRLPDRELPRRRVQDGGRHPQVLLQEDLLAAAAAALALHGPPRRCSCVLPSVRRFLMRARCAVNAVVGCVPLDRLVLFSWNKFELGGGAGDAEVCDACACGSSRCCSASVCTPLLVYS